MPKPKLDRLPVSLTVARCTVVGLQTLERRWATTRSTVVDTLVREAMERDRLRGDHDGQTTRAQAS